MLGSYESAPCPPGTYSNVSGAVDAQGCVDCDPGFYCSNARTPGNYHFNPLKTSPEYTRAGVYGKCVL